MSACEHGSLKRQCPWCENQQLEQKLKEKTELLLEALSFVQYAERDIYPTTGFSRFLNRDDVKAVLKEGGK